MTDFNFTPYHYKAEVLSIYDGDTMTVRVHLGLDVSINVTLRLRGINTPEVRGEERPKGLAARDYLRSLLLPMSVVYLETHKDKKGKYGRYVADVYKETPVGMLNINRHLVAQGHAVYKNY